MSNQKNYLYFLPISQRDVIEFCLDLDLIDMAIYELFKHIISSRSCSRIQSDGKDYYQFTRKFIIQQLPILGIKTKTGISNRLQNLVKAGMLQPYQDNQIEGISYFAYGEMHYKVHDMVATKVGQQNDTPINNGLHPLSNLVDTPIKNGLHNKNTIYKDTKNNKSEEKKKITRAPKAKKEPNQEDPNLKPVSYWQNELLNNPDKMTEVRMWCAEAAKEKIGQSLSVFRHTYTEQQLNAYCDHYAAILDVPVYKTLFTQTGEIISCDLVHHIINKAKYELEKKGSINIPFPKTQQVKRTLPAEVIFYDVKK